MRNNTKDPRAIDVRVSTPIWTDIVGDGYALVEGVLARAEAELGPLRGGALEVWFAGNDDLHALNKRFRGKDKPTNVLSFAGMQGPFASFGQLALADSVCRTEAQNQGITPQDHATHLVLHGLLHLQGYDHETQEDAKTMETLESTIMQALGLHDPYGRAGAPL